MSNRLSSSLLELFVVSSRRLQSKLSGQLTCKGVKDHLKLESRQFLPPLVPCAVIFVGVCKGLDQLRYFHSGRFTCLDRRGNQGG